MARRPTKVDRLPPEIKEEIARLRERGHSLDAILSHLRGLGVGEGEVSRTGLYNHIVKLDELGEMMRQDSIMADALVSRFGDAQDDRIFRANLQMMHALLFRLNVSLRSGQDGVALDSREMMFLTSALKNLAGAEKTSGDTIEARERRAAAEAVEAERKRLNGELTRVAAKTGLSGNLISTFRRELGIDKPAEQEAP